MTNVENNDEKYRLQINVQTSKLSMHLKCSIKRLSSISYYYKVLDKCNSLRGPLILSIGGWAGGIERRLMLTGYSKHLEK